MLKQTMTLSNTSLFKGFIQMKVHKATKVSVYTYKVHKKVLNQNNIQSFSNMNAYNIQATTRRTKYSLKGRLQYLYSTVINFIMSSQQNKMLQTKDTEIQHEDNKYPKDQT